MATAALATTSAALTATATAATPAQAIANLNAQRTANGIPAGITERADLDTGCAHHNAYEQANGGTLTHTEDSSRPGYTTDGADAAQHSVLSKGRTWDTSNPWETAPIHLAQLLAPRLDATGVDDSNGYTCAQTLASRNRPAPATPITYTYPGDGTSIYADEMAAEGPYTPGQEVGIPAGTHTGPYLYAFFDGPWSAFANARLSSATLTGPAGPVAIATTDNTTTGLANYLPTGALIIPRSPLAPSTRYTASVAADVTDYDGTDKGTVSHTWSFSTAASTTTTTAPPPTTTTTTTTPTHHATPHKPTTKRCAPAPKRRTQSKSKAKRSARPHRPRTKPRCRVTKR